MKILAIETSCDETSAAIVEDGTKILSSVVASSAEMQQKYGGIVPEIAARKQVESIIPVLTEALKPISLPSSIHNSKFIIHNSFDALAVTIGPGLIGSLLIGVETAKTLAYTLNKPIIPVNHVIAHMYANFIEIPNDKCQMINNNLTKKQFNHKNIEFPAISLVVSGGHTELFLMTAPNKIKWLGGTIDDAAGEAFDKGARILGFGSGGGLAIQQSASNCKLRPPTCLRRQAQVGTINYELNLPRPMLHDKTLNFSFSGLKTALMREVNKLKTIEQWNKQTVVYLSYELQEAITDVLVKKTLHAVTEYQAKSILISGGVASNLRLREKFKLQTTNCELSTRFFAPPVNLCTDNASFIASCAFYHNCSVDWKKITAVPNLSVEI